MTLADILSPVWTLSIDGNGAIAEGIDAILQCISLILRTTPGSDPLRPEFGCGLYQYVDEPLNVAIPAMKKAILDAIARWETRVSVTKITYTLGDSEQIIFNIGYILADGTLADSLTVSVSSGGVSTGATPQRLIIRAYFPTSGTGLQYQLTGQVNGSALAPVPPDTGFATLSDMYTWVQTNWVNYGQWYLTADSLIGYLIPGITSASVSISLLSVRQIIETIPIGSNYTVSVVVDGTTYQCTGLATMGDVLAYVQYDPVLSQLGTWQVASISGDYNDDFNDADFFTYSQGLELITDSEEQIQITITAN